MYNNNDDYWKSYMLEYARDLLLEPCNNLRFGLISYMAMSINDKLMSTFLFIKFQYRLSFGITMENTVIRQTDRYTHRRILIETIMPLIQRSKKKCTWHINSDQRVNVTQPLNEWIDKDDVRRLRAPNIRGHIMSTKSHVVNIWLNFPLNLWRNDKMARKSKYSH